MKNGATKIFLLSLLIIGISGCGDQGADGTYEADSYTDTSWTDWGGYDSHPTGDAEGDASPWPEADATSDPAADPGPEDAVEETEPPPEDVCDEVITEPQVLYLSADDSNSMASPIVARWLIDQGRLVPSSVVRTYEFTNYYDINYPPAELGRVNVYVHMKPETDAEDEVYHNMQIGVQAHAESNGDRRNVNITFIMDTSGSMGGTPIALERAVCSAVARSLKDGDVVSMVEWDVRHAVVLDSHMVSGPDDSVLLGACSGLTSGGGTDLSGGLDAGYELARANYHPSYLNRVILVSDGQANVGETDENKIAEASEDEEAEGIYLVGVGVGTGYNDTLMDVVTDRGKGAYVFIDSHAEAEKMFGERFVSTLEIAVMDVQVELTLPPWLRIEEFHGEEISTDPKEVEPQHLAPNDAMIFHQLLKACTELALEDTIRAVARYTDPVTRERLSDERSLTIAELIASQGDPELKKGTAVVEYAEGLKDIWDLKISDHHDEAQSTCDATEAYVSGVAAETLDPELQEISRLLVAYCETLPSRRW